MTDDWEFAIIAAMLMWLCVQSYWAERAASDRWAMLRRLLEEIRDRR